LPAKERSASIRVLLGTDTRPEPTSHAVHYAQHSEYFTDDEKDAIFSRNAERLFNGRARGKPAQRRLRATNGEDFAICGIRKGTNQRRFEWSGPPSVFLRRENTIDCESIRGETMVKRLDVEFQSEGTKVRGWLYVANESHRSPAVVLAGGWCYVREIVMPVYAKAFAEAGINALIFDYRNLGVSDGDDRQHLDPWAQIRDYQNALSFLERHQTVDPDRLGVWGISYSGGHALVLAAIDPRARSIVSQIPVIDGYENMRRAHGTMEYRALWDLILRDRKLRYEKPGERLYLPHAVENSAEEVSAWPFPETVRTFMAIKETEAPLYQNKSTVESVDLLMNYDVGPFVRRIYNTPTLMIVAEGDDLTLWDLEIRAFNQIPTTKKRLEVLPHTSHMTLYSDKSKVEIAAAMATGWFVETLKPRAPGIAER
jgi:uncharacterized protein